MLNLIATVVLFANSAVALDDNLAGGYAGIYTSVMGSSFARGFGVFWANWLDNATASFGGFPTPVPKTTPYDRDRNGGR